MRAPLLINTLIFSALIAPASYAETIHVSPGLNTLRSAVEAANSGDILQLENGDYRLSSTLEIDKSLTIRALNQNSSPRIYIDRSGSGSAQFGITISGAETDFILQGVQYIDLSGFVTMMRLEGEINSVALLENQFNGIQLSVASSQSADYDLEVINDLLVVGNHFGNANYGSAYLSLGAEDHFLFAGNTVSYHTLQTQTQGAEQHIIGNHFYSDTDMLRLDNGVQRKHVIGNVFEQRLGSYTNQTVSQRSYTAVRLSGSGEFINNVVKQGVDIPDTSGTPGWFQPLYMNGSDTWLVQNNVFDQVFGQVHEDFEDRAVFYSNSALEFRNNIIQGHTHSVMFDLSGTVAQQEFESSHNLCFNNDFDCPANSQSLSADPQFVDQSSYALANTSPAIDAGLNTVAWRDLDGSVVDLGVEGGAFPLSQFTRQRNATDVEPFLYPLFEANGNLANTGELHVKAAAIARLR